MTSRFVSSVLFRVTDWAGEPRPHENQAFAWQRHGLALQFHIEIAVPGLERWYIGHACEIAGVPGLSVRALREEAEHWAPLLAPRAAQCLAAWLEGLQKGTTPP